MLDSQAFQLNEYDESLHRVVELVASAFDVPIALVSIVDGDKQWFLARKGLDVESTPRDISFCGHAVAADELLVVEDATLDARFADNPLVTGAPEVRFYAGVPIRARDGLAIGTLCSIDTKPRKLSAEQIGLLRELANVVEGHLQIRHSLLQVNRQAPSTLTMVPLAVQEMRTQLTKILAATELLSEEGGLSERALRFIETISRSGRRINRMTLDLLDLSLLDAGSFGIRKREVELPRLAESLRGEFEAPLDALDITFVLTCSQTCGNVYADLQLLRRVLVNLIEQATDNSARGGEIHLSMERTSTKYRIEVRDEGPCLVTAKLESAFSSALSDEDIRTSSSAALSLAFCRAVVEAHGGTISVANCTPRGKRYIIELAQ